MIRGPLVGEEGSVAITVSLALTLFLSMLAVVIDLGQVWTARAVLASATNAATVAATDVLAAGECTDFDSARAAALDRLQDTAATAALDRFTVTYGPIVVDDAADCALVLTDEQVGRVDVFTSDTRELAFAGFFTDDEATTTAAAAAQWGYVESFNGVVRPLSLCSQNVAYLALEQYRSELALHEADPLVNPSPAASLLDPFDIEIDSFQGSACEDTANGAQFGEFVLVDFFGDSGPASQGELREWVRDGAPAPVVLDDPGTVLTDERECPGEDNDKPGTCEGVTQRQSLDRVSDFLPVLGQTLTFMLHDDPQCDDNDVPPDYDHCDSPGRRGHRVYGVDGFVRARVLCLRISANFAWMSPVSSAPGLPAGFCDDLDHTPNDGNPRDDVFVRLEFVLDEVLPTANLTSKPGYDHGFVGYNLCMVDGDDRCDLVPPVLGP